MDNATTARLMELQSRLRIRLAELGFTGVEANNVVHHLAEIAALAQDIADRSVPLFLDLSLEHKEALASVVAQLKCDLDELRDGIQDMELDLTELLKFLRQG